MTLYTSPNNFRAYPALIAAQFTGAQVKVATDKSQDFLQKFPLGKVPAFETLDGKHLIESNAIAFYLASTELRGRTEMQKAEVWQWVNFADSEILPATCAWVLPLLGITPFQKKSVKRAKKDAAAVLAVLNNKLTNVIFLVGDRISLADICVFCTLLHLYENVLDAGERAHCVSLTRWFNTMLNQPQVKAIIPNFQLCTEPLEHNSEKKEEKFDEQEEVDAAELALFDGIGGSTHISVKDPFENLSKGTFNMDDFKRCYSNEDEAKSIPYFWEKFDPENYSIWLSEYKYNEELTKVFMSCNLITGMFQRLDKMRKQAFASVCLWGDDSSSTISGVWVWRGKDLAFELSSDWQVDYDCYTWRKLDPSARETKDLVQQYFSWTGARDDRKFNQGKIFK